MFINSYCLFCEENLYIKCEENHKTHETIKVLEFIIFIQSINKIKNDIFDLEKELINLENLKDSIILKLIS